MKWKQIVAFAIFASVEKVPLEFRSVSIQNISSSREKCPQLLLIVPFGVAIPLPKSKFGQFGHFGHRSLNKDGLVIGRVFGEESRTEN